MKTRHSQSGHSLIVHLGQLALLAIAILFIVYACGSSSEQYPCNRVSPNRTSYIKSAPPYTPSAPQQLPSPQLLTPPPPPAVNIGVPPNANISATGTATNGESVIARQMMPRTQLQPAPPLPSPSPSQPEVTATAATSAPTVSQVKIPVIRQTVVRQKDSVGRMIIIATIIALAVIIFWFIHSNVMYKRTLRAVAASQTRKEEEEEEKEEETAPPDVTTSSEVMTPPQAGPHEQTDAASHPAVVEGAVAPVATNSDGGLPPPSPQSSVVDRLVWLKHLYDNGLISQADYEAKKKELLAFI